MVGRRARRYGVFGKTVHLYVRYAYFYSSVGKQQTLGNPINQSGDIYKTAIDILDTIELQQSVRLLEIRLTNLRHQVAQLPLFPQERRKALMVNTMDAVNNRFGGLFWYMFPFEADIKNGFIRATTLLSTRTCCL